MIDALLLVLLWLLVLMMMMPLPKIVLLERMLVDVQLLEFRVVWWRVLVPVVVLVLLFVLVLVVVLALAVVRSVFVAVLVVMVAELLEGLQMWGLIVVLLRLLLLSRCFLCLPLLLRVLLVVVLFPLLFSHCLFPGLKIQHHHTVIIAGSS
jgi:hypothetical protein